jgi:hypothetical protein
LFYACGTIVGIEDISVTKDSQAVEATHWGNHEGRLLLHA